MKIYLGIDIGWVNLAFVKIVVNTDTHVIINISEAFCVDLNSLSHQKVSLKDCKLEHSNDAYDKIQHMLQEYKDKFEDVDRVFIERQPIMGMTNIEQLLFGHFRIKATLVSPNAMHKFFKINKFDYETRKSITTKIADPFLKKCLDWTSRDRLHDMGDAFCLLIYSLSKEKIEFTKQQNITNQQQCPDQTPDQTENIRLNYFNQFKFNK